MWRGSVRFCLSFSTSFVWRCPNSLNLDPFPHPPSSNPASLSQALGSRTRHQTFVHGRSSSVGQAMARARKTLPESRLPRFRYNRKHHHLGDGRFLDKYPRSSFTSACDTLRSYHNLTEFPRVSPISSTSPLPVPILN